MNHYTGYTGIHKRSKYSLGFDCCIKRKALKKLRAFLFHFRSHLSGNYKLPDTKYNVFQIKI